MYSIHLKNVHHTQATGFLSTSSVYYCYLDFLLFALTILNICYTGLATWWCYWSNIVAIKQIYSSSLLQEKKTVLQQHHIKV